MGHYNPNKALCDCVQLTWSNTLTTCMYLVFEGKSKASNNELSTD